MSQFDEKISFLLNESAKLGLVINADLFIKVVKGLGPSIYNDDSSLVSTSDPNEINRVKENFLIAKLGVSNQKEMDAAISDVIQQFGSTNRNKFRAIFYYLLVKKLGKEHLYKD